MQFYKAIFNLHYLWLLKNRCNFGTLIFALSFTKIVLIPLRTKILIVLQILGVFLICCGSLQAQEISVNTLKSIPADTSYKQPVNKPQGSQLTHMLAPTQRDSTKTDSLQPAREPLTDIVKYSATDYSRFDKRTNKLYLYNEAEINYTDINIKAGQIIVDNTNNVVFAKGILDSAGVYTQGPVFVQAQNTVEPDSIKYNFKTEKALIYGSRTKQQEFYIKNEVSKRVNDSVVFMRNVRFTTSENEEDPEYYFYARKVKFVPGKKIVTGLVNMFVYDVPIPLGVPFAYFPMEKETSVSGFIMPSPGENNERGYFLQNGGYYFALSDYADLTLTGDYYTNGSYALRGSSAYRKRYKFSGNVNIRYERLLNSERGLPDFSETNTYNIQWSHSQDTKSSPNSRFSASVNLGSSNYFRQSTNIDNVASRLTNTLSSSVSYSKTFQTVPQVNLALTARHTQNTQTQVINMTLPSLQLNVDRIYPFAPKTGSKKGIIENINFNYSGSGENRFETTDSLFFTAQMFRDAELGVRHSIPITTNFKLFKHLSVSASTNYQESWVFETINQRFDTEQREIVRDTINGFDRFNTYNFSTSLGTTLYGQFNFGEDKKIQAIRHVIKPSVSFNYNPAFDQYYETFLAPELDDPNGDLTREVTYSRFDGGFYGAPGNFSSSGVSLSINNTVEAKVRDKDSTAVEPKKIDLISNLAISTNYNFLADSLKLSPISVRGTIPIIQSKLSVNFNMTLDPYALNNNNRRIDKLNVQNGGSLFRLTNASANFGYSFSSKSFEKNNDGEDTQTARNGARRDNLLGEDGDQLRNKFNDKDEGEEDDDVKRELYNYKIPWNLRVNYNVNYGNLTRQNMITSHAVNFSGDVELGERWFVGASSGVDLTTGKFTPTQLRFARDLESFNMTFAWTPFGTYASWNFFIGIKSSVLSDLKYEKRRSPDQRL
ncbi:putative LPS assembly protein LptD [Leeuwenhoekiella sp. W20_SRS_FM14]|uniref:putative LPS assembly protein LptD n=1 Tax=Leeuwenhoekiella sp. W20_SRS_FM14 TaxID=3240270 RepID=UPI003F9C336A